MNQLQVIEHSNQRILTTSQLAESFGTDEKRISENFSRNKDRYKNGKHYILLEGEELKSFKKGYPQFAETLKFVSILYLWTQKGAWLHAKSLNTDQAWDAYERLVDEYYTLKNPVPQSFAQALRLAAELEEQKERLLLENKQKEQIINELQPKATYYDLVLQTKSVVAISKIAKDYGMSGQAMNALLHELGVQYKQGDCWLLYQKYADKGYTQSKTHVIDSENSKMNTYWTQKGRLFIYDLLKNSKGLLPLIEREATA